jgi:small Trp-rich protein
MAFVILGVLLLAMKLLEFGPVAGWDWWWVLSPFPVAVAWWAWADSSGFTQRRAMDRMDEIKEARRQRSLEAIGQGDPKKRKR